MTEFEAFLESLNPAKNISDFHSSVALRCLLYSYPRPYHLIAHWPEYIQEALKRIPNLDHLSDSEMVASLTASDLWYGEGGLGGLYIDYLISGEQKPPVPPNHERITHVCSWIEAIRSDLVESDLLAPMRNDASVTRTSARRLRNALARTMRLIPETFRHDKRRYQVAGRIVPYVVHDGLTYVVFGANGFQLDRLGFERTGHEIQPIIAIMRDGSYVASLPLLGLYPDIDIFDAPLYTNDPVFLAELRFRF